MKWVLLSLLVVSIFAFIRVLVEVRRVLLEIRDALTDINDELDGIETNVRVELCNKDEE